LRFRLRSIFTLAVSESVIERNPAVSLFTPRNCTKGVEKLVLTVEDITRMMGVLELRERLAVHLATFEGMRPGEILGLQVGDIDGDSVWVRRRLYKGNIDVPKTRRSARRVALSEATVELLGDWVNQVPDTRSEAAVPVGRWIHRSAATTSGTGSCGQDSRRSICSGRRSR
jgi:integrase